MFGDSRIPEGVRRSFVSDDPLRDSHAAGIACEWIDGASPYRTYLCLYTDGAASYVIRKEFRFRRTRDGVEPCGLWDGRIEVRREYVERQLSRFTSQGVWHISNEYAERGFIDGEWYVVKVKDITREHIAYLYCPDSSGKRELVSLKRTIDRLMRRPRKYFERLSP